MVAGGGLEPPTSGFDNQTMYPLQLLRSPFMFAGFSTILVQNLNYHAVRSIIADWILNLLSNRLTIQENLIRGRNINISVYCSYYIYVLHIQLIKKTCSLLHFFDLAFASPDIMLVFNICLCKRIVSGITIVIISYKEIATILSL